MFLLSRPQPHEPWFFRTASPPPAQLWSSRPDYLAWSSSSGSDIPESYDPVDDCRPRRDLSYHSDQQNDLSNTSATKTDNSVRSVSWGDLPDSFDDVSDTSRAAVSARSGCHGGLLAPVNHPVRRGSCGHLVGSSSRFAGPVSATNLQKVSNTRLIAQLCMLHVVPIIGLLSSIFPFCFVLTTAELYYKRYTESAKIC